MDAEKGGGGSLAVDSDGVYVSGRHKDKGHFLQKYNFYGQLR